MGLWAESLPLYRLVSTKNKGRGFLDSKGGLMRDHMSLSRIMVTGREIRDSSPDARCPQDAWRGVHGTTPWGFHPILSEGFEQYPVADGHS